jgi:hypothetical protein
VSKLNNIYNADAGQYSNVDAAAWASIANAVLKQVPGFGVLGPAVVFLSQTHSEAHAANKANSILKHYTSMTEFDRMASHIGVRLTHGLKDSLAQQAPWPRGGAIQELKHLFGTLMQACQLTPRDPANNPEQPELQVAKQMALLSMKVLYKTPLGQFDRLAEGYAEQLADHVVSTLLGAAQQAAPQAAPDSPGASSSSPAQWTDVHEVPSQPEPDNAASSSTAPEREGLVPMRLFAQLRQEVRQIRQEQGNYQVVQENLLAQRHDGSLEQSTTNRHQADGQGARRAIVANHQASQAVYQLEQVVFEQHAPMLNEVDLAKRVKACKYLELTHQQLFNVAWLYLSKFPSLVTVDAQGRAWVLFNNRRSNLSVALKAIHKDVTGEESGSYTVKLDLQTLLRKLQNPNSTLINAPGNQHKLLAAFNTLAQEGLIPQP